MPKVYDVSSDMASASKGTPQEPTPITLYGAVANVIDVLEQIERLTNAISSKLFGDNTLSKEEVSADSIQDIAEYALTTALSIRRDLEFISTRLR